ncbi:MAG: amidohydrolase family protein, partial [Planctomycetota bacterium]
MNPSLILHNGKITTLDKSKSEVTAVAIADGKILSSGTEQEIMSLADGSTNVINLEGRRVIPGLIDSHTHIIRQGNNFAMELRWDHVTSLAEALEMLKHQALRTPVGQWIRVVGGWTPDQFVEKRLPTLSEINAVSDDVPIYVLHLYDRAWLNKAALRALGID